MPNTREKLIELLGDKLIFGRGILYEVADHLIANGVTIQDDHHWATEQAYKNGYADGQPKWISVKERLPEIVDSYLVVVKYKYHWEKEYNIDTDVATYNPYEKAYIDDCWNTYNDWNEGQQYLHVTHWMPLPEAPKDATE